MANPTGGAVTFKTRGDDTGGALTTFEATSAPGEGPPLHTHPAHDETLYVLDGFMRFRLGDDLHDAPVGTFAFVPRGVPHTWQNAGDTRARMLISFVPAAPGMEAFFRGTGEAEGTDPAELFRRVSSEGEMEIVGPPLSESHPG